jgi:phosphoribosylformylglycinamidine cyclo-ligase
MGYVRKEEIISGEMLSTGDIVLGVPSSGIHSNGLTLARKIVKERGLSYHSSFPGGRQSLGLELLEPTRIYVQDVLSALRKFRKKVHGLYNITGGGLGNLLRLNDELGMEITHPLEPQPIFNFLMAQGVTEEEMYRTFNMGMGFTVVVERSHASIIAKELGPGTRPIGSIIGEHVIRQGDICVYEY